MTQNTTAHKCAILVPSCDAYSDLWTPFFTLFFKYWNNCPYPVFLGANELSFTHSKVQMVYSNQGTNWTNRVKEQIEKIDADYIILFLEDFFIQSQIDQADVDYCLRFLEHTNGHFVRMFNFPGPTKKINGEKLIGEVSINTPYRISTQVAIWKKQSILDLMQAGESIWQFEIDGSKRSDTLHPSGYYCTWVDIMKYKCHVVERGKWFPWEAKKFKKMNIGCDFSKRETMTWKEGYKWRKSKFIAAIIALIPTSIRKRIGGKAAELPDIYNKF